MKRDVVERVRRAVCGDASDFQGKGAARAILSRTDLSPSAKILAACMALHCAEHGLVYMGIDGMVTRSGLARSTVVKTRRTLLESGTFEELDEETEQRVRELLGLTHKRAPIYALRPRPEGYVSDPSEPRTREGSETYPRGVRNVSSRGPDRSLEGSEPRTRSVRDRIVIGNRSDRAPEGARSALDIVIDHWLAQWEQRKAAFGGKAPGAPRKRPKGNAALERCLKRKDPDTGQKYTPERLCDVITWAFWAPEAEYMRGEAAWTASRAIRLGLTDLYRYRDGKLEERLARHDEWHSRGAPRTSSSAGQFIPDRERAAPDHEGLEQWE